MRRTVASRNAVNASMNALVILDQLARGGQVSLADAARVAGVSNSTAFRVLSTLEAFGLADRSPKGGYRGGARLLSWIVSLHAHLDTQGVAGPALRELSRVSGDHVYLALLRETGLTVVEALPPEPDAPPFIGLHPGAPIHATALGKAVAMHLEPTRLAALLGPEPYQRFTPVTPTSWRDLRPQLDEARSRGYATAVDEMRDGWTGVAAPIMDDGEVLGSVSVFGPTSGYTPGRISDAGGWVLGAVRDIEQRDAFRRRILDSTG
jgi:DNA-binding IclR family transcriptional regulator